MPVLIVILGKINLLLVSKILNIHRVCSDSLSSRPRLSLSLFRSGKLPCNFVIHLRICRTLFLLLQAKHGHVYFILA